MNLITSIVLATTDDEQLDLAKTYNRQIEEYVQQGLFKQALPLAKKVFKIRTQMLGKKHPDTLDSLNNLALFYYKSGRIYDSLPLFEESVSLRKEVLGENHPDTLQSLNDLADNYSQEAIQYSQQGLYPKLDQVYREILFEEALVQDGGNFQATYTRSRASMNAFPSRSLGTRINRFSRSQAPAWECMPRSSASSGLEISAILH